MTLLLVSTFVDNNKIDNDKNAGELLAILITMRMRWYDVGPITRCSSFTRSHWMPPLGQCPHPIAVAAAMVDNFVEKDKTLTKTYF